MSNSICLSTRSCYIGRQHACPCPQMEYALLKWTTITHSAHWRALTRLDLNRSASASLPSSLPPTSPSPPHPHFTSSPSPSSPPSSPPHLHFTSSPSPSFPPSSPPHPHPPHLHLHSHPPHLLTPTLLTSSPPPSSPPHPHPPHLLIPTLLTSSPSPPFYFTPSPSCPRSPKEPLGMPVLAIELQVQKMGSTTACAVSTVSNWHQLSPPTQG